MDISKTKAQAEVALQGTQSKAVSQTSLEQTRDVAQQKQGEQEASSEKLKGISERLNEQMQDLGADLHFGYNDKINALYIKVTEKSTGREIRKIPSEEAMRLAEHLKDAIGMIFDKKS